MSNVWQYTTTRHTKDVDFFIITQGTQLLMFFLLLSIKIVGELFEYK